MKCVMITIKSYFVNNFYLHISAYIMQAAVSGLQTQPIINAVIDGEDIVYRDYIDISIAVGTPKVCESAFFIWLF